MGRPRFTRSTKLFSGSMNMTPEQWAVLKTFYLDMLDGSRLPFRFPTPLDPNTVIDVRFIRPPSRSRNGSLWRVALSLRETYG